MRGAGMNFLLPGGCPGGILLGKIILVSHWLVPLAPPIGRPTWKPLSRYGLLVFLGCPMGLAFRVLPLCRGRKRCVRACVRACVCATS